MIDEGHRHLAEVLSKEQAELRQMRAELTWALDVIEHEVDPPRSCGACGTPSANCDGTCADAMYWSTHMRAIRILLGKGEPKTADQLLAAIDEARGGPAPTSIKGYA